MGGRWGVVEAGVVLAGVVVAGVVMGPWQEIQHVMHQGKLLLGFGVYMSSTCLS